MNWAQIVAKYLPAVLSGVVAVEAINAPGATKKQIVVNAIAAGAKVGEQIPDPQVQAVSMLVDNVVSTLNATGAFAKAG